MSDITWADKVTGATFTAADANEVKTSVNSKQDELTEGAFANGDKTLLDSIPAKLDGKENYHGIEAIGAVEFNDTTHVLSVASVTYWYQGVEVVSAVPITCDIDDTLTLTANTLYYFSFDDATGALVVSASSWNLHTKVPVALVMWNGTAGALMKEWHRHTRDLDWHINAHLTIGTRYLSGLALTTPTVGTPGALSIAGGTLYDEDLVITISNPQTTMRGWYLASAGVYTFADYALPYVGTAGQPQFLNTSDYSLDDVGASDFVCMWVYAGNDTARPIYIIPTHSGGAWNVVAQARAEMPPSLAGLNISPELKLLYKFIYRGNGAFIESVDYRQASSLPAGGTAATSAASVSFVPTGAITALDVQGAIAEVEGVASGAQPDLGTVGAAGKYLVEETALGVQGLYKPGNWMVFYTDGSEDGLKELSIGTMGHVLVSAGTGGPPVWEARGNQAAPSEGAFVNGDKTLLDSLGVLKNLVTVSGTPTIGGYYFLQDSTKTWTSNQWKGHKAALVTTHGTYEVTIDANGAEGFSFSPSIGSAVSPAEVTIDDLVETGVLTVEGIGYLEGTAGNGVEIILEQGTGVGTSTDTVTWDGGLETLTIFIDSDGTGTVRPIMAGNVETLINDDPTANLLFLATIGTAGDLVAGTYTLAGGVDGDMADGTYYIFDFQKDQVTIASGARALGTTEIANNTCATLISISAPGVVTTDVVDVGYNSTPVGKTGYDPTMAKLTLHAFPGADEINILVCNTTGAAVTPDAMTVNWRVVR